MIKKVLLIDVENLQRDNHNNASQGFSQYPLGLMYLSSAVKSKFPNVKFKIFHTFTSTNPTGDLIELLHEYDPDLIGLRSLSVYKKDFQSVANLVRENLPDKYIIAGGPYPSISYGEILKENLVDLVCIGEGEETFQELFSRFQICDELPQDVPGTVLCIDNEIVINQGRPLIADINRIPFPDYSLIDMEQYINATNQTFIRTKYASIFSSRGCPFQCFYCHKLFGKSIRRRSPENIVEEIKYLYDEKGIRDFIFLDDVFNVPLDKAKKVLSLISKSFDNIHIYFPNGLRADYLDNEFVSLLEECGCVQVTLAIESASPRLQEYIGKRLNLELAFENIDMISRKFITSVMYIVGFPTETLSEVEETISFAEKLKYVTQPVLNILHIYEDSPLLKILSPNSEQMKFLDLQSQTPHSERIIKNGFFVKPSFYGDYFSKELVPLNGSDILSINLKWIHKIVNDSVRIDNCYKVMKKYLSDDEIVLYYRGFLNNPDFIFDDLLRMMKHEVKNKKDSNSN
ncbi:MAG: B12-binding domain-containing radical SAM protein [Clostridiales bacterium]|nr:B12-binding domain-containing radical SAM protein [Clostridiales bacterium]